MRRFSIIRTKKIQRGKLKDVQSHNLRIKKYGNVDASRSHLNEVLIDEFDIQTNRNMEDALYDYYEKKGIKVRDNSIPMMEFVLTASPGFFSKLSKEQLEEWKKHQLDFAKNKWGDNIKFAVLHMDETSPHIHIQISTEQTTTKKYKNQFGEFHKETTSLNVKRFDRTYLSELQTEYAEHNKKFGLVRGMYHSKATHKEVKKFYAEVDKALNSDYSEQIEAFIDKKLNDKKSTFGLMSVKTIYEVLKPMLEKVLKENKTLKTFYKRYEENVFKFNTFYEEHQKEREDWLIKKGAIEDRFKKLVSQVLKDKNKFEEKEKSYLSKIENLELKNITYEEEIKKSDYKLAKAELENERLRGEVSRLQPQQSKKTSQAFGMR